MRLCLGSLNRTSILYLTVKKSGVSVRIERDVCLVIGGLAQLGERLAGSQKVMGSSPLSST